MTDIVERLRECIRPTGYAMTIANVETLQEAAATIERLQQELRAVLLHVADLRADNDRQRVALRNITIGGIGETNWTTYEMRAYAEDALRRP